jgi:hypothetical protein
MPSKKFNPRSLWLPKRKEVCKQCASCPFKEGNDREFGVVAGKLLLKAKPTKAQIKKVRDNVKADLARMGSGDFICHMTVLDINDPYGKKKPESEHRQCAGATKFWRGEE